MVTVRFSWTILIITMGFEANARTTDIKRCVSGFVNFNYTDTGKVQCESEPGYNFNDTGGTLSVRPNFQNGHYDLLIGGTQSFTIEDKEICSWSILGNKISSISIYLAPTFDDKYGCGICVSDHMCLWGVIVLYTENDVYQWKDLERVIFPLGKTSGKSDIDINTARAIADTEDEFVDIDVGQLHKLGAVSYSREVFNYLFDANSGSGYLTEIRMYLDVPIRITKEYIALKGRNTPTRIDTNDCQNVDELVYPIQPINKSLLEKANTVLVTMTSLLVWCINLGL